MGLEESIVISLTMYKLASLIVGLLCIVMGYKLFVAGIWGKAGDITTTFKDSRLVLKNAAPGTIFAVFGAVIILMTIIKGLEFDKYISSDVPDVKPKIKLPYLPTHSNNE